MFSTDQPWEPEAVVAAIGLAVAVSVIAVRIWQRVVRDHPPRPDPWSWKVDRLVRSRRARPVCASCLFPQNTHTWFCPHCGFPSGEYVNVMPFLQVFAIGEIARRGVTGQPDRSAISLVGFALFALAQYSILAPVYWFWMMRKARGRPIVEVRKPALKFEEN